MDHIVLDLGSDVNVLPKKTWDMMGKPKLTWSHVQLRLANQHKIILFGIIERLIIDIDGVCSVVDF